MPLTLSKPNTKLSLDTTAAKPPARYVREAAEQRMKALEEELGALQERMWGARQHSLLLILQGRDTSGKDGTIKRVAGAFNPRGVHVVSFGVPTQEEREHDFLWRIHRHAPRKGEIAIFNRSHYEDVLVPRVRKLVKPAEWQVRYAHINAFEAMLAAEGCLIVKVFLHISKEEQKERLLEREREPDKAWKLDPTDWQERKAWTAYTHAYEAAFHACAAPHAPWHIVPADSKPYRNVAVAEIVADAMRPHARAWSKALDAKAVAAKKTLRKLRR